MTRFLTTLALAAIAAALLLTAAAPPAAAAESTVFSFGRNLNGVTGLGTEDGDTLIATPIVTTNLAGKTITQVAAGGAHSLLLADDGTVFSFGSNSSGRTGRGTTTTSSTLIATPIIATNLAGKTITQVAAGSGHNLLLADDGTVFSFGENSRGATGLGTTAGSTRIATPIVTTNLAGKTIAQVAAGSTYSLLLADDGTVFSFGENRYGRTGLGIEDGYTLVATPIDTTNLAGRSITQVAGGDHHGLLLADDGTVFSFGLRSSALGLGTIGGNTPIATPIDTTHLAGKTITQIAASWARNLLLADDGTVFSFGLNSNGITGLGITGGNTPIATPIVATNLAGKTITQVAAGGAHSLLLAVPAAGGQPGDFNADGAVDGSDFLAWQRGLGTQYTAVDLQTWKSNFGATAALGTAIAGGAAVPEPAALVLVLTAMIARLGETRPRGRVSPRLESP